MTRLSQRIASPLFSTKAQVIYAATLMSAVLAGCSPNTSAQHTEQHTGTTQPAGDAVFAATAVMRPTAGHQASGTVKFVQQGEQVLATANMTGLPPGKHAYHVHLWGDCSAADGKSAGTHLNFAGSTLNLPEDATHRITGNLGDLEANAAGNASATVLLDTAQLNGSLSIVGRSVIVHAKANDHSQPPIGAAGGRLACGVIGAVAPS